jgi:DNA-binding response OmpR family regulator
VIPAVTPRWNDARLVARCVLKESRFFMQVKNGPRILLISAEQRLLDALCAAFRSRWPDTELLIATDATTGLDLVAAAKPSLVVLDGDLKDCNVLAFLADSGRLMGVPVVLLVGEGRLSESSRGAGTKAFAHLHKPFRIPALLALADRVLEQAYGSSGHPSSSDGGGAVAMVIGTRTGPPVP